MLNQFKMALQRAHTSKYLTITHDRTFNGKPLYYHKGGLVLSIWKTSTKSCLKRSANILNFVSLTLLYVYRVISMETIPRYSVVSFVPWSRRLISCVY